jgi:hypothetical protein
MIGPYRFGRINDSDRWIKRRSDAPDLVVTLRLSDLIYTIENRSNGRDSIPNPRSPEARRRHHCMVAMRRYALKQCYRHWEETKGFTETSVASRREGDGEASRPGMCCSSSNRSSGFLLRTVRSRRGRFCQSGACGNAKTYQGDAHWWGKGASWWCVVGTQLGTPRGRYDEHNSKFSLSCETKVIEPVGERSTLPKVDAS